MHNPITIAIDAMGGDDSPKKVIDGIELFLKSKKDVFFNLYGDENKIKSYIKKDIEENKGKKWEEILKWDFLIC